MRREGADYHRRTVCGQHDAGEGLMKTFLGMEVEQLGKVIRLHLDSYIQDVLAEYKAFIKRALRPRKVLMSPELVITNEDCPITLDPRKQKDCRSFIAKVQFAASWIRFDTSFAVSTLARFCASSGPSHSAALHHLMEYLGGFPLCERALADGQPRSLDLPASVG
jgi:hypothetical protein